MHACAWERRGARDVSGRSIDWLPLLAFSGRATVVKVLPTPCMSSCLHTPRTMLELNTLTSQPMQEVLWHMPLVCLSLWRRALFATACKARQVIGGALPAKLPGVHRPARCVAPCLRAPLCCFQVRVCATNAVGLPLRPSRSGPPACEPTVSYFLRGAAAAILPVADPTGVIMVTTVVRVPCGMVRQLMRQLIQLVPGEAPRFLIVTPQGKLNVLTSEQGETKFALPHGVWKPVPYEELSIIACFSTGTLSVRPECHRFGRLPYVSGLWRDEQKKSLVIASPDMEVDGNIDILRDALFLRDFPGPLPRIKRLFLWLHPERPAQMLALLVGTKIVRAAFSEHGERETITAVDPANGSHVWYAARDEVRVTISLEGRGVERC